MKLAVCDLTGLFMSEIEEIAKALKIRRKYRKIAKTGEMSFPMIKEHLKLLSDKSVDWIYSKINKTKPFPGAIESINLLRENNFKIFLITDDPLMSIKENKKAIIEKLKVDNIFVTSKIKVKNNFCVDLKKYKSKSEILKKLIQKHKPKSLLGIVQGLNDIELAREIKKKKGFVFAVNSHSPELERISDVHIENIKEVPEVFKKIL